ncbi:adiponectin receptor protein 1 [Pseudovirgaria hyperparasitica]|uniref:Adiponectin receptor protein 1 n=1 Tax=Pseudovirgaria hyperparasitica TaxID=470096 RepID=A0A6A6W3S4_9PEZI|nr:adiponectin receptor protein 1 [Pseudovirgaria hyperparasitica]KAF2757263.1 adiponectin receptor protein 1 [Pseudovirgaria hyperparasitica]
MSEHYEEPNFRSSKGTYGTFRPEQDRRRRHSSYDSRSCRSWNIEHDDIQILVDRFLSELNKRLEFMESFGHLPQLKFDAGIEKAYFTLQMVRDSCSKVSNDVIDAGRQRSQIFVETIEKRYKEALATKETLEQKAHEGVRLMEAILSDFEARAYALREAGIGSVAQDFLEEGRRRLDAGYGKAKGVVDDGLDKARRVKDSVKESMEYAIMQTLARAKERGLLQYEDLPDPWKNNPHIINGYRFYEGKLECVRSIFSVSNESFNIWSHLLGLLAVLCIAFYFYPSSAIFTSSTKADVFVAAIFFFAACKCLACSTMWHTMNSIADHCIMERFACVDYTGISLLVAASIMTTEYTAFYCEPASRWTYMLTTAALGIGGVVLPWHPTFNRADMAWARVCFYCSLALTGFLPVAQLVLTRGAAWAYYFYAPVVKSVLVYFVGAVLYASKTPERWWPGMFDYVGGSHNIWHLAVVIGILFHYLAMHDFFREAFLRASVEGTTCSAY